MSPPIDPGSFLGLHQTRWNKSVYVNFAVWTQLLGLFLILAPPDWFGPSWSYYSSIPHNGTGMGICLVLLSGAQLVAIANNRLRATAVLLFLGGFVFWTAGLILGAEGLFGHQGLMEAPFMCTIGAYKFAQSATLRAEYSKTKLLK